MALRGHRRRRVPPAARVVGGHIDEGRRRQQRRIDFNSALRRARRVLVTPIELVALVDAGGRRRTILCAGARDAMLATLGRVLNGWP